MKLEELHLREAEEYRTGIGVWSCSAPSRCRRANVSLSTIEVIDLTHPANVELFRRWDQTEVPFIDLLRFIRISSSNPDVAIVSRPGKHRTLLPQPDTEGTSPEAMEVSDPI